MTETLSIVENNMGIKGSENINEDRVEDAIKNVHPWPASGGKAGHVGQLTLFSVFRKLFGRAIRAFLRATARQTALTSLATLPNKVTQICHETKSEHVP